MAWIHIDAQPQAFTLNEQRVKDMLDAGKNMFQIAAKMYMGIDYVRDMIYSIRKKEAIILAKLSNRAKGEIYRSYKNGTPQTELAKKYGVTKSAICQIIQNLKKAEREVYGESAADKPMPNTGINPEFDAAVDSMIAEAAVEDSAAPLAEGVQDQPRELEPVIMAPDKLPECVVTALVYRLACIEEEIQHFRAEIDKLEAEHEQLAKWKEAHDD